MPRRLRKRNMSSSSKNDLKSGKNNSNQSQPPPEIVTAVEKMALWVYGNGWEFELSIIDSFRRTNNAKYNFMMPSDPYHRFYKAKLAEYYGENFVDGEDEEASAYLMPIFRDPSSVNLTFGVPEGMMRKELDVIKLTACFSARYGRYFWRELKKSVDTNPEFDFMKESDSRRSFLTGLCMAYWYMMPKKYLVRNEAPDLAPVLGDFFHRLRCVNERWQMEDVKAEMVIVDCRPFFDASNAYAECEDSLLRRPQIPAGARLPLPRASRFPRNPLIPSPLSWMRPPPPIPAVSSPSPSEKASLSLPEEPEPKNEFLTQHPGCPTIRVSVPNVDDVRVIKITMQSLSETVASLKENLAKVIQIPAHQLTLSGKSGILENIRSLAHCNLGGGEILTLSF